MSVSRGWRVASRLRLGGPISLVVLAIVCAAADLVVLRRFVLGRAFAPGEMLRVRFARVGGRTAVELRDHLGTHLVPDGFLDRDGQMTILPGNTAAVPLPAGRTLRVRGGDAARAPLAVLAWAPPPERAGRWYARAPRTLALEGGALALRTWDPDRPFAADAAARAALLARCAPAGGEPLRWTRSADALEIALGACRLREPVPADSPAAAAVLIVPGARAGARVERDAPSWRLEHEVRWPMVALIAAKSVLLVVGTGALAAASTTAVVLLALLVVPPQGLLLCALALLAGLAAALARAAGAVVARRRPAIHRPVQLAVALAVVGGAAVSMLRLLGPEPLEPPTQTAPAPVVVTGYSMAAADTLADPEDGLAARLARDCAAAAGAVSRTRHGGTAAWVADTACAGLYPVAPGGTVAFVGGGNDDFFWPGGASGLGRLASWVQLAVAEPRPGEWTAMRDTASARSLAALDAQREAFGRAAACLRSRGATLSVFHDFLVWDLGGARAPDRSLMLEGRRDAVRGAGGRFVDLLAETAARASVAWFNDFIHLSAVGHEAVAALVCERLRR